MKIDHLTNFFKAKNILENDFKEKTSLRIKIISDTDFVIYNEFQLSGISINKNQLIELKKWIHQNLESIEGE